MALSKEMGMSEVERIIAFRLHQNEEAKEEAKITLLTTEWIVSLPGTLLEVRRRFGSWYWDLSFIAIVLSEEMDNDTYDY